MSDSDTGTQGQPAPPSLAWRIAAFVAALPPPTWRFAAFFAVLLPPLVATAWLTVSTPAFIKGIENSSLVLIGAEADPAPEPATAPLARFELTVSQPDPATAPVLSILAVEEPDGDAPAASAAGPDAAGHDRARAMAESAGVLLTLVLLGIAFMTAGVASAGFSARASWVSLAGTRWRWVPLVALAAGLVIGWHAASRDPLGPLVTADVGRGSLAPLPGAAPSDDPAPTTGADADAIGPGGGSRSDPAGDVNIIGAAAGGGLVTEGSERAAPGLVLACGALGGGALFAFLGHMGCLLPRSSGGLDDRRLDLIRKKQSLAPGLTVASVALSLGVAIINAYLGWGLVFLDEDSREVATLIVSAGTSWWGGLAALATISGAAVAFVCLQRDIEAEALLRKPDAPADWKKANGLDFEPVKTLSTIVVALGPVLTSGLLNALSKSVA